MRCGVRPQLFRPPVGVTGPRLKSILADEGMTTVTFSCRPFDHGNRKIDNLAGRIMGKIRSGDILLLHDLPPETDDALDSWQNELNTLFNALQKNDNGVQALEALIGLPVMSGDV